MPIHKQLLQLLHCGLGFLISLSEIDHILFCQRVTQKNSLQYPFFKVFQNWIRILLVYPRCFFFFEIVFHTLCTFFETNTRLLYLFIYEIENRTKKSYVLQIKPYTFNGSSESLIKAMSTSDTNEIEYINKKSLSKQILPYTRLKRVFFENTFAFTSIQNT